MEINEDSILGGYEKSGGGGDLAIADLSKNKTLLALKLTSDSPAAPEVHTDIENLKKAFETFKPGIEVDFEGLDEGTITEELNFSRMSDFGAKGIIAKSPLLNAMGSREKSLRSLKKSLENNGKLKKLLGDPEAREGFIELLKSIVAELDETEK